MSVPRYWRMIPYRYKLEGFKCRNCGYVTPVKIGRCPKCGKTEFDEFKLSKQGEVYSFTVIYSAPRGFEHRVPYVVGIIKLKDGVKVLGEIVDCKPEDVEIGMPVEMVFRKIRVNGRSGIIEYGFKFKPIE